MASRISQMRNGTQPYPQTSQQLQQQRLNESIAQMRNLMQQVKNSQNPEAALAQILQNNPNISAVYNMLKSNPNLEGIAKQMAQASNLDINQIIQGLSGGI